MFRPEGLLPEGIGSVRGGGGLPVGTPQSEASMPTTPELVAANGNVATPLPVRTDVTVLSTVAPAVSPPAGSGGLGHRPG